MAISNVWSGSGKLVDTGEEEDALLMLMLGLSLPQAVSEDTFDKAIIEKRASGQVGPGDHFGFSTGLGTCSSNKFLCKDDIEDIFLIIVITL